MYERRELKSIKCIVIRTASFCKKFWLERDMQRASTVGLLSWTLTCHAQQAPQGTACPFRVSGHACQYSCSKIPAMVLALGAAEVCVR